MQPGLAAAALIVQCLGPLDSHISADPAALRRCCRANHLLPSVHTCARSIVSTSVISCFFFFGSVGTTLDLQNTPGLAKHDPRHEPHAEIVQEARACLEDGCTAGESSYDSLEEVNICIGAVQEGWPAGCGRAPFNVEAGCPVVGTHHKYSSALKLVPI